MLLELPICQPPTLTCMECYSLEILVASSSTTLFSRRLLRFGLRCFFATKKLLLCIFLTALCVTTQAPLSFPASLAPDPCIFLEPSTLVGSTHQGLDKGHGFKPPTQPYSHPFLLKASRLFLHVLILVRLSMPWRNAWRSWGNLNGIEEYLTPIWNQFYLVLLQHYLNTWSTRPIPSWNIRCGRILRLLFQQPILPQLDM